MGNYVSVNESAKKQFSQTTLTVVLSDSIQGGSFEYGPFKVHNGEVYLYSQNRQAYSSRLTAGDCSVEEADVKLLSEKLESGVVLLLMKESENSTPFYWVVRPHTFTKVDATELATKMTKRGYDALNDY